jgi:16S rRNA (cytosine1402-N4)-methyltransferase
MEKHISVLLNESISKLDVKSDGIYIDATLGRAGHSKEILKNIKTGKLYCFDKDQEAIDGSTKVLKSINDNFEIIHSDFSKIGTFNEELIGNVDGILFDLGVSSPQLDKQERGFSYHNDGPLDMRMNKEDKLTAYEVVNEYSLDKLAKVFRDYGEDRFS